MAKKKMKAEPAMGSQLTDHGRLQVVMVENKKLREALTSLLDMLTEWDDSRHIDSSFSGSHTVNQAERALGRPESAPKP